MASKLLVSTDYLEILAAQLDDASGEIDDAKDATEGVQSDLWLSHGCLSGESNVAAGQALEARDYASQAVADAFTALQEKLLYAATQYDEADNLAAGSLQPTVADRARSNCNDSAPNPWRMT